MENKIMPDAKKGFWDDAEVISIYTHQQAIDDGVLVDLSSQFPDDTRIYKYPIACTSSVWALIDAAKSKGQDYGSTVWDLCYMSAKCATKKLDESTVIFKVSIPIGGRTYTLKANCGLGDNAEPVITIMREDED